MGVIEILTVINGNHSAINLPAVFIANGLGACLMIALLLSRYRRVEMASLDGKIFVHMCRLSLMLCVLEAAGFAIDGRIFWGSREIYTFINVLLFAFNAIFASLWVCYVDYKLFSDMRHLRTVGTIVGIPSGIIVLMCVANFFTDIFFSIGPDNVYQRKPLCVLPYMVSISYMTYGAMIAFLHGKKKDRHLLTTVLIYLVPVVAGALIQYFNYGLSLIWVSTAFGLTYIYINLQHEMYYLDSLTGLYNRSYLFDHLVEIKATRTKGKNGHILGMMLDINDFKSINDTYGHQEGDVALCAVGEVLKQAVEEKGVAVRYGGDEFVILLEGVMVEEGHRIWQRIQKGVEQYNNSRQAEYHISLAVGIAELQLLDIEAFFREMDRNMYTCKREFYQQLSCKAQSTDNQDGQN